MCEEGAEDEEEVKLTSRGEGREGGRERRAALIKDEGATSEASPTTTTTTSPCCTTTTTTTTTATTHCYNPGYGSFSAGHHRRLRLRDFQHAVRN